MPSYKVEFTDSDEKFWRTDATLNILQTSKDVHEEAQAVLYKHSTIVFSYKEYVNAAQQSEPAPKLSVAGFQRVEIRMDHCLGPPRSVVPSHFWIMPRFCKMFMDQLAGVNTSRKDLMTVTMRLDPENCSHQVLDGLLELWHDQPLTTSLGKLTEFRSVVIEWHEACRSDTVRLLCEDSVFQPCDAIAK